MGMNLKMAPLPGTFMLTGMLGFIISAIYTASGRVNATWGFAFSMVFFLMFIASMLSMMPQFPDWAKKKKR